MRTVRILAATLVALAITACDTAFVEPALAPASISFSAVPSENTAAVIEQADEVIIFVVEGGDSDWWSTGNPPQAVLLAEERLPVETAGGAFRARLEVELDGSETVDVAYVVLSGGERIFFGLWQNVTLRSGTTTNLTAGGMLFGTVVSATTGETVADADVRLLQDGRLIESTRSNDRGDYALQAPTGSYTVEVEAEGFIEPSATTVSLETYTTSTAQMVLAPRQAEGETRIVLSWGETPRDLDSHITGPDGSGETFHVYYVNRGSLDSTPFTFLDHDDTSSFGPETVTIMQQFSGTYCYSVHNYSGSPAISTSEAVVRVYQENEEVGTFNVPQGTGRVWTVFSMNGSTITPINNISDQTPPGECGRVQADVAPIMLLPKEG